MSPHDQQILNEQIAADQRVITEVEEAAGADRIRPMPDGHRALSIAEIQDALRAQIRCATCGKARVVINLFAGVRRGFHAERVTPATHCTCPPLVDANGSRHAGGPAWELVSDECEHCDHGEIIDLVDGYQEKTICGICQGIGRVPKPGRLQERAS
jgi:hypothetical protein